MTPRTLDEAMEALDKMLKPEDKARLATGDPAKAAGACHHGLGRKLRNDWGLWANSPLAQHIRETYKITHPDDISHHILVEYCKRLAKPSPLASPV